MDHSSSNVVDIQQLASILLLSGLVVGYVIQLTSVVRKGRKAMKVKHATDGTIRFNLFACVLAYDEGIRSVWVFIILALALPICLSSLSDLAFLIDQSHPLSGSRERILANQSVEFADRVREIIIRNFASQTEQGDTNISLDSRNISLDELLENIDNLKESARPITSRPDRPFVAWLYFLCLASLGVLITLEFSYLHTLRSSAPDWTSMLLVTLALDLLSLLTLIFIIQQPHAWSANHPQELTYWSFLIATFTALVSSIVVIILARTAAAFRVKQIEAEKIAEKNQLIPVGWLRPK